VTLAGLVLQTQEQNNEVGEMKIPSSSAGLVLQIKK